jgi:hypothetical protein
MDQKEKHFIFNFTQIFPTVYPPNRLVPVRCENFFLKQAMKSIKIVFLLKNAPKNG